jgi:hypothetical protein
MSNQIIAIACYRTGPEWPQASSADLATAITELHSLSPMTLTSAFQAAVANGGVVEEYGRVYSVMNNEFVVALKTGLHNGDLLGVSFLMQIAKTHSNLAFSQASKDAIDAVIAANSLRLVDVVAAEIGEDAPETVTAADVDAALGR